MRVYLIRHAQSENNALTSPNLDNPSRQSDSVFDEKRMGTVRDTDRVVRERIEFDVQRSDGNMDVADEAMPADRESSRGRTENGKRESTRGDF